MLRWQAQQTVTIPYSETESQCNEISIKFWIFNGKSNDKIGPGHAHRMCPLLYVFWWHVNYMDISIILFFEIIMQYCDCFMAPRWYIGPTAMPREAVTPIAPERIEDATGCDSHPMDDIPAWRTNTTTLLACLWRLAFVLNNTLILGIWCSTIPHLPGCFCPWTFFQNIGFNMVPSDTFMAHLATQLGYFTGDFQAFQLIVLATFGVVD